MSCSSLSHLYALRHICVLVVTGLMSPLNISLFNSGTTPMWKDPQEDNTSTMHKVIQFLQA